MKTICKSVDWAGNQKGYNWTTQGRYFSDYKGQVNTDDHEV